MKGNCLPIVKFDEEKKEMHLTNDQDDYYSTVFQSRDELDAFIDGLLVVRNNHFPTSPAEELVKTIREKYQGKRIDLNSGRGSISGIVQAVNLSGSSICLHLGTTPTNYIIIQNINPDDIGLSTNLKEPV